MPLSSHASRLQHGARAGEGQARCPGHNTEGVPRPQPALPDPEREGLPKGATRCLTPLCPAQLPSALGADCSRVSALLRDSIFERPQKSEKGLLLHASWAGPTPSCSTEGETATRPVSRGSSPGKGCFKWSRAQGECRAGWVLGRPSIYF